MYNKDGVPVEDWLTVDEAAALIGVQTQSVYRAIRAKRIPVEKFDGQTLVTRRAAEAYRDSPIRRSNIGGRRPAGSQYCEGCRKARRPHEPHEPFCPKYKGKKKKK